MQSTPTTPSSRQHRVRTRIAQLVRFPLVRLLLATIVVGIAASGARVALRSLGLTAERTAPHHTALMLLGTVTTIAVVHVAYLLFVHHIEGRAPSEFASSGALRELGVGTIVGAALFSLVMLPLAAGSWYRIAGVNPWSVAIPSLLAAARAAYVEELVVRGILFRNLEELLGSWISLAVTALLFGLAHLGNPNATMLSAVAIALEAGVLLAAAFILTHRLWLAIGIHFAWNFVQGGIFGIAVSGVSSQGILRGELRGPTILTGGQFGVEGSATAVVVCLAEAVILLVMASRRGNVMAPAWRRAAPAAGLPRSGAGTMISSASGAGDGENP